MTFEEFGFADPLARAIESAGLTEPTPIQTKAIPHVMAGRDVLGVAQTGTGKTLAFVGPIVHGLLKNPRPRVKTGARALILAPTRELAAQIGQAVTTYTANARLSNAVVIGGVPIMKHIRRLQPGVDVLIATPGRLLDLVDRGAFDPRHVQTLVLDEADQMLDLGFIKPLRRIAGLVPRTRQTMFFSATMAPEILALSKDFLRDAVKVEVSPPAKTADRVDQRVIFTPQGEKIAALAAIIRRPELKNAIVFTRTKHGADKLVKKLAAEDLDARAIHGGKAQGQRERALRAFKGGEVPVLIATDIAARGLDISGLSHVVNFELPNVPEQYVHRIGRTGRAGAAGLALSLVDGGERGYLRDIERLIGRRIPAARLTEEGALEDAAEAHPLDDGGPRHGPARAGEGQGPKRKRRRPNRAKTKTGGHSGAPQTARNAGAPAGAGKAKGRPKDGRRRKPGPNASASSAA